MAIQQKRSATPGAVPTALDLLAGEIAINTADGQAYILKDNGAIVSLGATGATGAAGATGATGATGAAAVIGAGSVTYANIQNVTSAKILGRATAGSGSVEEITLGTGLSLTGLTLNAGATSAADTAISVDAVAMYSTVSSVLGVVPSLQVILPASSFTLANSTATQAVFDVPNDTITLAAATSYIFEGLYLLQTGATSHFTSMSFVLTTATITNITWFVLGTAGNGAGSQATSQTTTFYNSSAGGQVIGASTNSNTLIKFQGVLRVDVGGTMVPNIKFSAAPGSASVLLGSYFKIYPVGSNTISSVGSQIG